MSIWLLLALLPSMRADAEYWLSAPEFHVALSGDIEVSYRLPSSASDLRLLLVQLAGKDEKSLAKKNLPPKLTKGKVAFACNLFDRPGKFTFKLMTEREDKVLSRTKTVEVQWPDVTIHVPLMVETYTSEVSVQLYVNNVKCKPRGNYRAFVDLFYEGSGFVVWQKPAVLTSKELPGWMWDASFDLTLECNIFDRPGNYTVQVRTNIVDAPVIAVSDIIMAMWSRRYSLSIAQNSVKPCDGAISVTYIYPPCILNQDRIRVYGKSLKGPMKYVRESRIVSGKHSTKLSCDIFDDDYQEYCFSFVSIARNGAVFDLKTQCVPTSSDDRLLSAMWSEWGPWSECSTTCDTGVQTRYRICLSSTNNSKCIGKAVQSRECNDETCSESITTTTTESPTVLDCPCGCERNLTTTLFHQLIPSECESDVWWSVHAWPSGLIIIEVINLVFPSSDCWLTIRDGKTSLGTVIAAFSSVTSHRTLHSLSSLVRIEVQCSNGSLNDIQIICRFTRSEIPQSSLAMVRHTLDVSDSSNLSAVHVTIIMLAAVLYTTIVFLVLVYFYRKYKLKSTSGSSDSDGPELLTSASEISIKTPSACPEDYLYKSFIFRSATSLHPKLKWDKLPTKVDPSDTSSPVRRRGRPTPKAAQRESTTPLAASISELSMTGSEDGFEYDYYDYGCHQEPGSFFCTDPVLVGWPPFIPLPPQGTEEFGDFPLQHFTPSPDHS